MTIERTGNDFWVCWTNDYAPNAIVEQNVESTVAWLALTNKPVLTSANTWTTLVQLGAETRFYRFRLE
jgi:hypothetical protein